VRGTQALVASQIATGGLSSILSTSVSGLMVFLVIMLRVRRWLSMGMRLATARSILASFTILRMSK
jgi:hypothetical protein